MAKSRSFAPSGFFVIRTPLLPFAELTELGAGLTAAAAHASRDRAAPGRSDFASALERAIDADLATLRARLARVAQRPEVAEALFLGSPSLEERLLAAHDAERALKTLPALFRYFARMTARSSGRERGAS
jgi:hypothetical protein